MLGRAAFADASDAQWGDWQWQQQNRLRTAEEIGRYLALTDDEIRACAAVATGLRVAVTPYYLSLIDPEDPLDPIRRQAIPTMAEQRVLASEVADPLGEDRHMVVPGLTHRYPDRVLLYATHNCPVYCRFCLRKRKVSDPTTAAPRDQLEQAVAYVREHPEVRDVAVSGGDPLTFSDERLDALLGALRAIPHVEILRLHTRNPATLPMRVTEALAGILRRHHPVYVNVHFNHPRECTEEAARALELLVDAGCVLGNQMVLLAGVNDRPETVATLNRWLLRHRCRPYYVHQCDAAEGVSHFRTPIAAGLKVIEGLRGWSSGLGVPHYVVDLPGGGGKVALAPDPVVAREGRRLTLRSYRGDLYTYEEG